LWPPEQTRAADVIPHTAAKTRASGGFVATRFKRKLEAKVVVRVKQASQKRAAEYKQHETDAEESPFVHFEGDRVHWRGNGHIQPQVVVPKSPDPRLPKARRAEFVRNQFHEKLGNASVPALV
jgi:hypothetical protein